MSVIVKYKTAIHYCGCCDQKLPEVKTSEIREFEITKATALSWTDDWDTIAEYLDDLESMVPDFVHETIDFWAMDLNERLVVEDSEIEKVKEFILREVVQCEA